MSLTIVPFAPAHVHAMVNHGTQEHLVGHFTERDLDDLATRGPAWTAMRGGDIIGCAGLIEAHRFRATAWVLVAKTSPRDFVGFDRAVRHVLKTCGYARIEAYVDPRSDVAMRWIALLGFEMERAYIPFFFNDGSGASEWALYPDHSA